jgi:hypothetical protein
MKLLSLSLLSERTIFLPARSFFSSPRILLIATAIFWGCALNLGAASDDSSIVDLRPKFSAWNIGKRKQGVRNTCSVCVTASAFEFALSRNAQKSTRVSAEYLNWACNQVINNTETDRGQFFHDLLTGFEKFGICEEPLMPYRPKFDPEYQPSEEARKNAARIKTNAFQIHWIRKWDGKFGLDEAQMETIKSTLRAGWPVAAGSSHSLLLAGFRENPDQPGGGLFVALDSVPGSFRPLTFEMVKTNTADALWIELPDRIK